MTMFFQLMFRIQQLLNAFAMLAVLKSLERYIRLAMHRKSGSSTNGTSLVLSCSLLPGTPGRRAGDEGLNRLEIRPLTSNPSPDETGFLDKFYRENQSRERKRPVNTNQLAHARGSDFIRPHYPSPRRRREGSEEFLSLVSFGLGTKNAKHPNGGSGFWHLTPFLLSMIFVSLHITSAFSSDAFESEVRPLVDKLCSRCHGPNMAEAGIDLANQEVYTEVLRDRLVWIEALHQIESGAMPPEEPKPTDEEKQKLTRWIQESVVHADWKRFANAGRVSLARMTEIEYRHAIRDTFGIDLQSGVYLGRDPEGATGFTNDRDNLSFPLFAMQDYVREAERAVDAFLGFRNKPWTESIEMEEAWRRTSDKSAKLTTDEQAVIADDDKAPFHFGITVPHAGMYRMQLRAYPFDGEPISGLELMANGRRFARLVIAGQDSQEYSTLVNLPAGFNTITLAFDASRAPLLQPKVEPESVPEELEKQARRMKSPKFPMPAKFERNKDAVQSFNKLNNVIADYFYETRLIEQLLKRGEVDYESNSFMSFRSTKVPFNLSAGKVSVLLGIPQKVLEQQLKINYGFDHADHVQAVRQYKEAYAQKHPDRVRKIVGKVAVDRVTLTNLALAPGDADPTWVFGEPSTAEGASVVLDRFAQIAYRRTPTDMQRSTLMAIYEATVQETGSHFDGLRDALVGMLVSPAFLIHFVDNRDVNAQTLMPLENHELASRLSFFLWLTIPDEKLRKLASTSELRAPMQLDLALQHLIHDPKFSAFCRVFVEQWLNLQTIEGIDLSLEEAMRAEPALLLEETVRDNRSILDLLDAKHTWLNEVLAHHYDIPGVKGLEMRRVELSTERRGGLMAMGATLTATSTTLRTSPVTRGAWIAETLLGVHLPPPPPSVPELKPNVKVRSIREELELHRNSTQCSGCHEKIDPYGFVLEHYDRVGAWRDKEGKNPINASTRLDDGTAVNGLDEFKVYLRDKRSRDFARNLVERVFEFGLGREVHYYDEALIRDIVDKLEQDEWRAQTLFRSIISSDAFLNQNNGDLSGKR